MFGLVRFCWSCEIPMGTNLRGGGGGVLRQRRRTWGNAACQSCDTTAPRVQRYMGGMLPRGSTASPGCVPQSQGTTNTKPHATNSVFKSCRAFVTFLRYCKTSAQSLKGPFLTTPIIRFSNHDWVSLPSLNPLLTSSPHQ